MAKILFKTGEFAKLCNTTKDTLFHYDQLGLLKPAVTGTNGYRYYSSNQIYFFDLIATLKEVGLSLQEIKSYISIRDTQLFLTMLKDKYQVLQKEQEQINRRKKLLMNTIKVTETSYDIEENKIDFAERAEEYFIFSETIQCHTEKAMTEILGRHLEYCTTYKYYDDFSTGEYISQRNLENNSFASANFFSRINKSVKSKYLHVKPAGTYAVKYIRGSYNDLHTEYKKFYDELTGQHMLIDSGIYQEDITNYLSEKDADDYLMKLEVKLK